MAAAATAGTATRALPLFYALSQAGRAITAAWREADDWNHHGHGLTVDHETYAAGLGAVVGPPERLRRLESFQVVSDTVMSRRQLDVGVPLGALMMSLPDLVGVPMPGCEWRRPLNFVSAPAGDRMLDARVIEATVDIGPENLEPGDVLGSIRRTLSAYPTARDWQHPRRGGVPPPQQAWGYTAAIVLWWAPGSPHEDAKRGYMDMIAPEYRFEDRRWLRPSVVQPDPDDEEVVEPEPDGEAEYLGVTADWAVPAPAPIMTWWALLFGFSMFARYEPANWARLLDVETSNWAVAIEHTLGSAIEVVPHLVRDELLRSPSLYCP